MLARIYVKYFDRMFDIVGAYPVGEIPYCIDIPPAGLEQSRWNP